MAPGRPPDGPPTGVGISVLSLISANPRAFDLRVDS